MEQLLLFDEQYERPPNDEHLHMFAYRAVGGGAENRTPVHTILSLRLYKLIPLSEFEPVGQRANVSS